MDDYPKLKVPEAARPQIIEHTKGRLHVEAKYYIQHLYHEPMEKRIQGHYSYEFHIEIDGVVHLLTLSCEEMEGLQSEIAQRMAEIERAKVAIVEYAAEITAYEEMRQTEILGTLHGE